MYFTNNPPRCYCCNHLIYMRGTEGPQGSQGPRGLRGHKDRRERLLMIHSHPLGFTRGFLLPAALFLCIRI